MRLPLTSITITPTQVLEFVLTWVFCVAYLYFILWACRNVFESGRGYADFWQYRQGVMIGCGLFSLYMTPAIIYHANRERRNGTIMGIPWEYFMRKA